MQDLRFNTVFHSCGRTAMRDANGAGYVEGFVRDVASRAAMAMGNSVFDMVTPEGIAWFVSLTNSMRDSAGVSLATGCPSKWVDEKKSSGTYQPKPIGEHHE
jgi:hypothetical protein